MCDRAARKVAAALAACVTLAALVWATASTASNVRNPSAFGVRLALPSPTGPYAAGRDTLLLTDRHRRDPWVPSAGARRLMVSLYYPARAGTGRPAPYMTAAEARLMLRREVPGLPIPAAWISGVRTGAYAGARPVDGRFPLVVLSPGLTFPRATLTGLAVDLSSRGYVVAAVDHTYESSGVTFPGGRTRTCAAVCDRPPRGGIAAVPRSRATDVSFVLDELVGRHPAWRYARMIDPRRIGMAGHSIGGDAAVTTMAADRRVRAGVNLDGTDYAPVPAAGLGGRPVLLLGTRSVHAPGGDRTWDRDWTRLDGGGRWLTVTGADHASFTDLSVVQHQIGLRGASLPAGRAMQITRAYVAAFFDLHLKHRRGSLLDGPSSAYPEVVFQHRR